jgi:methionyl-tRNA formyltransferase
MKTLLILGNDKLSQLAISKISLNSHFKILIDKSTNLKRIYKLITKKIIKPSLLVKMFFCELCRKKNHSLETFKSIKNNKTLITYVKKNNIKKIILFRAGLIINKTLIKQKITILNIHAAKVPKYGGIGSIQKALLKKEFNQYASLHFVNTEIDKGRVIDREKYKLKPNKSYCYNEEIAYLAGIKLLTRALKKSKLPK